mmetsp:Transcript_59775/g.165241  ORF Transcript_59775/g.165241 Transcript_59775/m.165241 type:complete len:222 (+) Transcript_59775:455-1120(+)
MTSKRMLMFLLARVPVSQLKKLAHLEARMPARPRRRIPMSPPGGAPMRLSVRIKRCRQPLRMWRLRLKRRTRRAAWWSAGLSGQGVPRAAARPARASLPRPSVCLVSRGAVAPLSVQQPRSGEVAAAPTGCGNPLTRRPGVVLVAQHRRADAGAGGAAASMAAASRQRTRLRRGRKKLRRLRQVRPWQRMNRKWRLRRSPCIHFLRPGEQGRGPPPLTGPG